jgi:hypothetical protein
LTELVVHPTRRCRRETEHRQERAY